MALPLDPADRNFVKILNLKQSVSSSILTATARVRQDQLKPAQQDHMAEVLRRVKLQRLGLVQPQKLREDSGEDAGDPEPNGAVTDPVLDPDGDDDLALLFS